MVVEAQRVAERDTHTAHKGLNRLLLWYVRSLNRYPTPDTFPKDPDELFSLQKQEIRLVSFILEQMPDSYDIPPAFRARMNPHYTYDTYSQGHFMQTFLTGLRKACYLNKELGLRLISFPQETKV